MDALLAAGLSSSSSSSNPPSNTFPPPPQLQPPINHSLSQSVSNLDAPSSPTLSAHSDLKTPGLDFLTISPNSKPSIPASGQFYWTPFPDHSDGMPLPLPSDNTTRAMDISSVLDSGVNPLWAQLNRDGFTIGPDDANALCAGQWDQHPTDV
jgi:hypothetical protein